MRHRSGRVRRDRRDGTDLFRQNATMKQPKINSRNTRPDLFGTDTTIPVIFMSVGDAVTGIVRNYLYKKRTKSWWGNLVMAAFSMTVGSALGAAGVVAGGLAAFVEHYEFYPIDDNVTIPLFSFLTLLLARIYAPWMLAF